METQNLVMGETLGLTVSDVQSGLYRVDWLKPIGQVGYPWASGMLYLEHRPDLYPIQARGLGMPGKLRALSQNPYVKAAIRRPVRAIASTPLRLERPELPEWATTEDYAAAERQWQLCQRAWDRLTKRKKGLAKFTREVIGAAVDGFYLGEKVYDEQTYDFEGFAATYLVPRLPELRASWTVRYWLTQREQPIGVVLENNRSTDYGGGGGSSWIVIPWKKLVHVAAEMTGSNLEGEAWIRPVVNHIEILNTSHTLEALAAEVNGVGEMHVTLPDKHTDAKATAEIHGHLQRRKAGQAAGMVLPFGTQVTLTSPMSAMPDFGPMQSRLIQAIAIALDESDQLIALQQTGSYAARADASAEHRDGYDYLLQEYVAAPLEDVLETTIEINFPGDVAAGRVFVPTVGWGVVEERDIGDYIGTLGIALQTGILSAEDMARAKPTLLELLDLPQSDDVGESGISQDAVGADDDPWSGEFVTTAVVAQKFGVRPSTIVAWAKAEPPLINARKIGSRWSIDLNSVRNLLRNAPVAGVAQPVPQPQPEAEAPAQETP